MGAELLRERTVMLYAQEIASGRVWEMVQAARKAEVESFAVLSWICGISITHLFMKAGRMEFRAANMGTYVLIINFDGAVLCDIEACILGVVVRDHAGAFLAGGFRMFEGIVASSRAEMLSANVVVQLEKQLATWGFALKGDVLFMLSICSRMMKTNFLSWDLV
ncbi:hypothetical protein ACH5RR_036044 [Cinchona calisaya]|uniref:RNase H type-1 domain-containing protein n=1 Tax=Cinchona calisaya TaxID=153742 RepID=A0ABD2Y711_9GENT